MMDDNFGKYMIEWVVDFERHRDIMAKQIVSIDVPEAAEWDVLVKYKEGERRYIVVDELDGAIIDRMKDSGSLSVVTINSRDNLNHLIENWDGYSQNPDLVFIFINPFSVSEKRWIVRPYVHARISERSAIKQGLKAMFGVVDAITKKEFKERI